jgi:hypothetical protein
MCIFLLSGSGRVLCSIYGVVKHMLGLQCIMWFDSQIKPNLVGGTLSPAVSRVATDKGGQNDDIFMGEKGGIDVARGTGDAEKQWNMFFPSSPPLVAFRLQKHPKGVHIFNVVIYLIYFYIYMIISKEMCVKLCNAMVLNT